MVQPPQSKGGLAPKVRWSEQKSRGQGYLVKKAGKIRRIQTEEAVQRTMIAWTLHKATLEKSHKKEGML